MIILDSTTRTIEVLLAGSITTSQLPVVASYSDTALPAYADFASLRLSQDTQKTNQTQSNNTTAVTVVAAPSSGQQRRVEYLSIFNADTVAATVTVQLNDNSTLRIIAKEALAVGDTLYYSESRGWYTLDSSGNLKVTTSSSTGVSSIVGTSNQIAVSPATGNAVASLEFSGTVPGNSAVGDSAAVGTSGSASRLDHTHGRESFATPSVILSTAGAAGVATTPIRSDSTIAAFDATVPVTQAFADAAATGSVAFAARRDHTHGMPTNPITAHEAAGDPHTGYRLESADHTHQSTGAQAGQLDHGLALTGLSDNDHPQYGLTASSLAQFAATTSAELRGVLSDENGTGVALFDSATSPTFTTSLLTGSTTFSLINTTATTVNFAGAGTAVTMGGTSGYTNFRHSIFINETSNAKMARGLTITQAAGVGDEAIAAKAASLAHGITTSTETDTYFSINPLDSTNGGADLSGYSAATRAFRLLGTGVTDDTTKTTDSVGYINFLAGKKSGTSIGAPGADGNMVVFLDGTAVARFIFDVEGTGHADVAWTTYQDHDDYLLLKRIEAKLAKGKRVIELTPSPETQELIDLGFLGKDTQDVNGKIHRGMLNTTKLQMLQAGAVRQAHEVIDVLLDDLMARRNLTAGEKSKIPVAIKARKGIN